MAYHRHIRSHNGRLILTLGITEGNLSRMEITRGPRTLPNLKHRGGPIEFDMRHPDGVLKCVLRLAHHALPHPERSAITLSVEHTTRLREEGLIELSLPFAHVVCVYGHNPVRAGAALRRAVGDA